jgi:hypothetical protein
MCDAEHLLGRAKHEIDMQRGNGSWNLARIQTILNEEHDHCDKDT